MGSACEQTWIMGNGRREFPMSRVLDSFRCILVATWAGERAKACTFGGGLSSIFMTLIFLTR